MTDIATFLNLYPLEIKTLAHELRQLIKDSLPDIDERVYPGWQLIGYRQGISKDSRYFAFLAPFDDYLKLGFEWGILMRDGHHWLEGGGKQVRHITLRPGAALDKPALSAYLIAAAQVAHLTREQKTLRIMALEEEERH